MNKRNVLLSGLLLLSLFLTACSDESANTEGSDPDEALQINTTVYPLKYFAERIAGEHAEVSSILPAGSDPHSYEPTTKEMVKMAEADGFIYNGAGLESYAKSISDAIESEDVNIMEASAGIDLHQGVHNRSGQKSEDKDHAHDADHNHEQESQEEEHGHDHGDENPHIWLDPLRSVQLAENIKSMLIELKPEQEDQFENNFASLKKDLEQLDEQFHNQLKDKAKNELIVSHAAYGYWEEAYGLEQIAVSGLSPTNEPSQKEMEHIITTAEEKNVEYVLFEQNITPKVADVVRKEIGAEPLRLHNLSVLTEEDIEKGEDYISLMNHNLNVLNKALSE
ncbi:metal ABC transporter solute-binding protein, Zn/Mn family [Thalassobacillus sp. CUG 92003]|uniref:metal ABC transporter solute-binding protein, Zn/Mn family n=1 Tax=Thalassobacillus sp. CUG 92003 TaxID=2736641 RepID=UPI0015E75110|nr:zinc ABC transporter substrate-binding protein [Thalassobacillus sp. CUG 92003]